MIYNYLRGDYIISPLGFGTENNLAAVRRKKSALDLQLGSKFFPKGYYAGIISEEKTDDIFTSLGDPKAYTKLEKLMLIAIKKVLDQHPELDQTGLGLIISTTKGNIDQAGEVNFPKERLFLWGLAKLVTKFFNFEQDAIVVSNACISGGLAIKAADAFMKKGKFKNVIVVGGDLVSEFVLAGFQSLQAISSFPCRPYSNDRSGISLGEAVVAVLVGPDEAETEKVAYIDACTANDANHISGPSRTGEGLYLSIDRLFQRNKIKAKQIDYLSAHGTATFYNDEMESIAFQRAGLQNVPVNSLKAYFGHSLGSSALLESIFAKYSLLNNELFTSLNYSQHGVSQPMNIIRKHKKIEIRTVLKTASGFGGCNIAMLFKKISGS
ncbi:beta-ketoacyl synthase [Christiangramia fulva]|uniref:Beta-ketoacyl synthase n=1 Tax=Christiangramia fulva TaxID=2126553 RepID=A0A2R3Z848_9FLAO|nr:beta-ketoacyl synthase N-terminal-like domain-containing protein [Christiangramia fulva]AVR46419.1 beta-ketoacyl synthase [Christiangramia fulva]